MRIFQRGVNEGLVIGRNVVITVLEIQSTWVRLGIRDPNSFPEYWEQTLFVEDDGQEDEFESVGTSLSAL